MSTPSTVKELIAARRLERPQGAAAILSLGTANPPTVQDQSTYADYYFRVTGSDDMLQLKRKFQRICEKTTIKKRHTSLTDDLLTQNPNLCTYMSPSLDVRQQIAVAAITTMAAAASSRAIDEWGRDKSLITHLVLCTTSTTDLPGVDHRLLRLLGLRPSVQRVFLPQHGCAGGATVLRVAKDLAENNRGARVLAVCVETAAIIFRGPSEEDPASLVRMSLFGDGAAAAVVGADPCDETEKPIFEIVSAAQTILPESDGCIAAQLKEVGLVFQLERGVLEVVDGNIRRIVEEELGWLGVGDLNSLFWAVHPGGPAVVDSVERGLGLGKEKLGASRRVLEEYGNMSSATVLFVLDEMRRRSQVEGLGTTGEGCELGMLIGIGPGITVGSVVLRSVAL